MSSLLSQVSLLIYLLVFLGVRIDFSCTWRMLSFKTWQLSCSPLPFRAASHEIPPTTSWINQNQFRVLNPATCFHRSLQDVELHYFMSHADTYINVSIRSWYAHIVSETISESFSFVSPSFWSPIHSLQ